MRIFLSYPHEDKAISLRLREILLSGGQSVWFDNRLTIGRKWRIQLEQEIKHADAIALALTTNWINSPYCQWEFVTAVENGKKVIPVLLEKIDPLPKRISQFQYTDFISGFGDTAKNQKFLDDLVDLAVIVDANEILGVDKEAYAIKIDQEITLTMDSVVGDSNTVVDNDFDQRNKNIRVGDIQGANVNISGSQTIHGNVEIRVGSVPTKVESIREMLNSQVAKLFAELGKQPPEQSRNVERVRLAVEDVVAESEKPVLDKARLQIRGDSLVAAAKDLSNISPIAEGIARTLIVLGSS